MYSKCNAFEENSSTLCSSIIMVKWGKRKWCDFVVYTVNGNHNKRIENLKPDWLMKCHWNAIALAGTIFIQQ